MRASNECSYTPTSLARPKRRCVARYLALKLAFSQEGGDALRDALRHRGRHPRAAGLRRLLHGLEGAQGRAALRAEARVEPDARRPREGLRTPQARRAAAPRAPHPIPSPLTNHVERRIDRN